MSATVIPGGPHVDATVDNTVRTDGLTIGGNGTTEPLFTMPGGTGVVTDGVTVGGDGTDALPLHTIAGGTAIVTDNTLTGNGTTDSQLSALLDQFQPGRTLLVSKAWPTGHAPLVFFTSIQSAITQAATLTPLNADQITLETYSTTYTENLTCVSNVNVRGRTSQTGTDIAGSITWTPGAGVNAPQAAVTESLVLDNIFVSSGAALTVTVDPAKTGSVQFYSAMSTFQTVAFTGRHAASDNAFFYNPIFLGALAFTDWSGSATNIGIELVGARHRGMTVTGLTTLRIEGGGHVSGTVTLVSNGNGHPTVLAEGTNIAAVVADAGSIFTMPSGNITGTLSGAGTFDVRGAVWGPNSSLTGITGTCNRSKWVQNSAATSGGAGVAVTIAPVFPDKTGKLQLQLISGPGNAAATAAWDGAGTTGAKVNITDTVDTNVWQVTILVN